MGNEVLRNDSRGKLSRREEGKKQGWEEEELKGLEGKKTE